MYVVLFQLFINLHFYFVSLLIKSFLEPYENSQKRANHWILSIENWRNENWAKGKRIIFWERGRHQNESKQKCCRVWNNLRGEYLSVWWKKTIFISRLKFLEWRTGCINELWGSSLAWLIRWVK
jgi:hypothetical protein